MNAYLLSNAKAYDAIIVGGGHNGLVAASYLAKARKATTPLEAQDELAAQKINHNR